VWRIKKARLLSLRWRVQGVGFRYFGGTRGGALGLACCVRNSDDAAWKV